MLMKIGIPRALLYYNFYPFWHGFFEKLGIEVILSSETTKKTMSEGSKFVVSETCLPVKVYMGHVMDLINKGIKNIFVPSIQSIAPKIYNCSKLRGLPDLVRNVIDKKINIIDATLDLSENKDLYFFLAEAVKPFGIFDMEKIKEASKYAWQVYNNFHIMRRSNVKFKNALNWALSNRVVIPTNEKEYPIKIALLAHGYNLYDEMLSMKIFDKLEKLDAKVYTAENLTVEQMQEGLNVLVDRQYWANELEMTGAAGHFLQDNEIDGIITINAFSCGPDSLMIEKINRNVKRFNKHILNLSIDEQTGEAGFVTRVEAFIDMLFRKKRSTIIKKIDIKNDANLNNFQNTTFEQQSGMRNS